MPKQEQMSAKEYQELLSSGKYVVEHGRLIPNKVKNKYNAEKVIVDGILFDSTKEAKYYVDLKYKKLGRLIKDFRRQVAFPVINSKGKTLYTLRLDFVVENNDGTFEYIDVKGLKKGTAYRLFLNKKKSVENQYKIVIREV